MVPPPSTMSLADAVNLAKYVESRLPGCVSGDALDRGEIPEVRARLLRRLVANGQDELLPSVVPEFPVGAEIASAGDGDLERVLGEAVGDATGAALLGVHKEAGVVRAEGASPDEDRIDAGSYRVDAIEVLGVGEYEPFLARSGVEVAVN